MKAKGTLRRTAMVTVSVFCITCVALPGLAAANPPAALAAGRASVPTGGGGLAGGGAPGALSGWRAAEAVPASSKANQQPSQTSLADGWAAASLPAGVGYLADVVCPRGSAGYACVAVGQNAAGTAGVVLTSSDGGATWTDQSIPSSVNALFGVSCADASHCWAVGQQGPSANYAGTIVATADGGKTWATETPPSTPFGAYPWIRHISCVSASGYRCWAVAPDASEILATADGGMTWTLQSFPAPASGLAVYPEGVDFVSATTGYFVGGDKCGGQHVTECPGFIYKTTDGGASWQAVFQGVPYMDAVSCTDAVHCWAVASTFLTGVVLTTSNGGTAWSAQSLPGFSGEMSGISCSPYSGGARCWAVGDNGYQGNGYKATGPVLLTTSSGTCWAEDGLPGAAGPLYGTASSGLAQAWAAGTNQNSTAAQAWSTATAAAPPVVTSVSPTGGPFVGKTKVTIHGCGFTPASHVSFGSVAAGTVTYVSPSALSVTTAPISLYNVGPQNVTVNSASQTSTPDSRSAFTYYAPEIGRLVFHTGTSNYEECTASVVNGTNQSVVLTAGHCVGGSGSFANDFAFAPGYYGPVCTGNLGSSAAYLKCGTAPYGIWSARKVASNNQWLNNGDHDLDWGFLVMNTRNGKTIQQAINGGLSITFNPGRGQRWTTFGEPAAVILHCSGQSSDYNGGSPGPDMLTMPAPTCAVGGSSGGPWINGSNGATYGIGAVNSEASAGSIYGAYMGTDAQNVFQSAENS